MLVGNQWVGEYVWMIWNLKGVFTIITNHKWRLLKLRELSQLPTHNYTLHNIPHSTEHCLFHPHPTRWCLYAGPYIAIGKWPTTYMYMYHTPSPIRGKTGWMQQSWIIPASTLKFYLSNSLKLSSAGCIQYGIFIIYNYSLLACTMLWTNLRTS